MTATDRLPLAKINLALMISDAKGALLKLTDEDKPNALQTGILLGLKAAGMLLDGRTADEAWAKVEPVVEKIRRDTQGAT